MVIKIIAFENEPTDKTNLETSGILLKASIDNERYFNDILCHKRISRNHKAKDNIKIL